MARSPRPLAGRVAAVTGGARGIGRATAAAMLRAGMKVAIGDIDTPAARQTADELGDGALALEVDVTRRESFERFVDDAEAQLGPLDVLVNNAGIMTLGPLLDEDDATARRQVDINVHGVLYGMKIALPRFLERDRGHLVNIASMAGKTGFPGAVTYCGTKHFVVGVSEAARQELRGTPVEVSVVMPALVNTELTAGLGTTRLVKPVEPEDVAAAIVEALRLPRFDVYVPKSAGRISAAGYWLPRRAREAVARSLKTDRVLVEVDAGARRAYELRAGGTGTALEPPDEPRRLTEKTGS